MLKVKSALPKLAILSAASVSALMAGCASVDITKVSSETIGGEPQTGISYYLPKLEVQADVSWNILDCANGTDLVVEAKISETARYVADPDELYFVDTQQAVGGLLDNKLSLSIDQSGILTGFDVSSVGQATEVAKSAGSLLASLTGSVPGMPFGGGPRDGVDICQTSLYGKTIEEWGDLRATYHAELQTLENLDTRSDLSGTLPENLAKVTGSKAWIDPAKAKARRDYLLGRLTFIDTRTTFSRSVSFDPVDMNGLIVTMPYKDLFMASSNTLLSSDFATYIQAPTQIMITTDGLRNTGATVSETTQKNALIYRVPTPVTLTYTYELLENKRLAAAPRTPVPVIAHESTHLAPQAGLYAKLPIRSDAFGSVETKMTFGKNGMVTSYGFTETTGLPKAISALNDFKTALETADNDAIDAEITQLEKLIKLKEAQDKLEGLLEEDGS